MQLPLNVSPVSASFFGLQRLGIHLVLSLACALLVWLFSLAPTLRSFAPPLATPSHIPVLPGTRTLAFLCFSLSSCLGNIEVIILMQL